MKKIKLKTKRFAKSKPAENLPFIIETEKLLDPATREHAVGDDLSSTLPSNKQNIDLAEEYRKVLPRILEKRIPEVRDFFLREIAPTSLGTMNGLIDAHEILTHALGEEPDSGPYSSKMQSLVNAGLEIKMISFVGRFLKLDPDETKRFILTSMSKDLKGDDLVSTLLKTLSQEPVKEEEPVRRPRGRRRS